MLDKKLKELAQSDMYPFHMPGHKRVVLDEWSPYLTDITEIDEFDDLHHAADVLLESQKRAAKLYGSKECFYLVNGSTCGILTALFATLETNGRILIGRNCHKSVYNGIGLLKMDSHYVYPNETVIGIQGQTSVAEIEKWIKEKANTIFPIQAVLITSPTYDGVVSDIAAIAEVVHKYNIPLIVDAAHGAHLGFSKDFPENPIRQGADIVIESVHKTLPAFTQTALLHVCSDRVSVEKIKKYLSVFETTSPSYILMAGIERCIAYLEKHSQEAFVRLKENLDYFYERAQKLEHIKVVQKEDFSKEEAYDFDISKILIFSKNGNVTGKQLYDILREKYHLQMEMASGQYVLAMTSIMDTKEAFERLLVALEEMDKDESLWGQKEEKAPLRPRTDFYLHTLLAVYQAENPKKHIMVSIEDAKDNISGDYLYLYPPGIPLAIPGELLTEELIDYLQECKKAGLTVRGIDEENRICIVN